MRLGCVCWGGGLGGVTRVFDIQTEGFNSSVTSTGWLPPVNAPHPPQTTPPGPPYSPPSSALVHTHVHTTCPGEK